MKKSRFQSLKDYLAVIIRRKWWILGAFVFFAGFAGLFAWIVPDVYESESTILIQQRDIPSDFVKDLVASNTDQRLNIIQKRLLSRTNLLSILEKFGDEMTGYGKLNDEQKVLKLAQKITIDFPSERVRGSYLPVTSIRIAYKDQDAKLAQKITEELTSLFMNEDRKVREDQVNGTTEFLSFELNKISDELKDSEAKLQALKGRNRYELPEELDNNQRALDRLQEQKNSSIEALDRSKSMKINLEQQLSQVPPEIPREQAMKTVSVARDPAVEAYRAKERQYRELLASKKETHPDVRRLKAELEELKKGLSPEALNNISGDAQADNEENAKPAMVPNPAYQNLQTQLQQVNTDIEVRQKEKTRIEEQMALYNKRVADTPKVAQQLTEVLRVNEDLNKQHDSLKEKLAQAQLSESAENREQGTQFGILDEANYPYQHAPPGKAVIFLAGLLISLVLGVGVAFAVDMASPVVFTQSELERVLQTKVLVEIPRITTPSDVRKNRIMGAVYAASFVVLTGLYGGCLYYLSLRQTRLLQILDPVIQKLHG